MFQYVPTWKFDAELSLADATNADCRLDSNFKGKFASKALSSHRRILTD